MIFNMKRFLAVMFVGHMFVAQADMSEWVDLVKQRPAVAAKAIALIPLGFGAFYFGGYTVNCGLEAFDAYKDHRTQNMRNINGPLYDHRADIVQKSFESFVSAVLAVACVKLAHICYQSLKADLAKGV